MTSHPPSSSPTPEFTTLTQLPRRTPVDSFQPCARLSILAALACLPWLAVPACALNLVPSVAGDPHFTSGPCPKIAPPDGAACPNGAASCPAFYNPQLLPAGYDSVSYCAAVPAGIGFNSYGYTLLTMPLTAEEQQAFLAAAQRVESYVKDDVTVTIEVYKVAYLLSLIHI